MALDTEFYTISDLLDYYNDCSENCHYKIYVSDPKKDIIFGQGNSEGELLKDLQRIAKNNLNRNKYFLSIYSEEDSKKPFKSSSFQLHTRDKFISGVKEELEELIEEEEEEENYVDSVVGYIKQVFPPQTMQQLIFTLINNFLTKNNTITNMQEQTTTALSGVNENEAITILSELMSKGVTLEHLRKLNSMDKLKLNSLLLML